MKRGKDEQSFKTFSHKSGSIVWTLLKMWGPVWPVDTKQLPHVQNSDKFITYQTLHPKKWKDIWVYWESSVSKHLIISTSPGVHTSKPPYYCPTDVLSSSVYCGKRWNPLRLLVQTLCLLFFPHSSSVQGGIISSAKPAIMGIVETTSSLKLLIKAQYQK